NRLWHPAGRRAQGETTLCDQIRANCELVVIDDVAGDAQYCGHHTPAMYGFQSYISVPIIMPDRSFFGTLCAIDPTPRNLNNTNVLGMFALFADLIALHLDLYQKLIASEEENARLKERFRAGLGHDMRNTLAAMDAGTRLLQKTPLDQRAALIVTEMQASALKLSVQIAEAMQPTKS
ncbi:MAG TPA: GAF domain-containing protein, partial [Rhizomicrobium sp.]|nr:GAF domain-containing protein [Rhizomicrobium sp.]